MKHPKTQGRVSVLIGCLTTALSSSTWGVEVFYDYAPVLDVEPLVETEQVPVRETVCPDPPVAIQAGHYRAGDVRALTPGLTLAETIRHEWETRRSAVLDCRVVTRYRQRDRVVAYRVTYQYADETFVKRMRRDPGERVQVRVELDAPRRSYYRRTY